MQTLRPSGAQPVPPAITDHCVVVGCAVQMSVACSDVSDCADVSGLSLPVVSNIDILVEHDMEEPIYIYYILTKFYQNHKRYVKSVDWEQVHGEDKPASELRDCKGQKRFVTDSKNVTLERNGLVNPCGLVSWSFFNDTFADFKVRTATAAARGDAVNPKRDHTAVIPRCQ